MCATIDTLVALDPWADSRLGAEYRPELDCLFLSWLAEQSREASTSLAQRRKWCEQSAGTATRTEQSDVAEYERGVGALEMLAKIQAWVIRRIGARLNGVTTELEQSLPAPTDCQEVGF